MPQHIALALSASYGRNAGHTDAHIHAIALAFYSIITPSRMAELCDRSFRLSFCYCVSHSVCLRVWITHERVNGRRPNTAGSGKW